MNNSHYTVCVIFVALLAGAYKHNTTIPGLLQIPLTVSEGQLLISEIDLKYHRCICVWKIWHKGMYWLVQQEAEPSAVF